MVKPVQPPWGTVQKLPAGVDREQEGCLRDKETENAEAQGSQAGREKRSEQEPQSRPPVMASMCGTVPQRHVWQESFVVD